MEHVEASLTALAHRGQFVQSRGTTAWPDGTVSSSYGFIHTLYQEILYERLPAGRRARCHQQIGVRCEAGFGAQAPEIATELAMHFVRGRDTARAVSYLRLAAEQACHAYAAVQTHLRQALDLLPQLPDTPGRRQDELAAYVALGAACTASSGFAAPETGHAYTHALALARQLPDTPHLAPLQLGLWVFYHVRAELHTALERGEVLLRQAERLGDSLLRTQAHHALGISLVDAGRLHEARQHLLQGWSLYQREHHAAHTALSVYDPAMACAGFTAHALWLLGEATQAVQWIQTSLQLSRDLDHPYTLAGALSLAAVLAQYRGAAADVQTYTTQLLTLCEAPCTRRLPLPVSSRPKRCNCALP